MSQKLRFNDGWEFRWYSGAGIYRNVWLKRYPDSNIVSDGIYVVPRKENDGWSVSIDTEVKTDQKLLVRHTILYNKEETIACFESVLTVDEVRNDEDVSKYMVTDHQKIAVKEALLWDIESPNLYQLKTELVAGECVIDREVQNFGFRTVILDPENGFLLNGRKVKLNGVCEHHDLGCLGAAFNKTAMRRKFVMLQEMGVNAVRTSHNMPAAEVMDLADEMGISYEPGEIFAIAYGENGEIVATAVRKSFGDAKSILITPDKNSVLADGEDLIFAAISMLDIHGNEVENANNRVEVSVTGAGRLIG